MYRALRVFSKNSKLTHELACRSPTHFWDRNTLKWEPISRKEIKIEISRQDLIISRAVLKIIVGWSSNWWKIGVWKKFSRRIFQWVVWRNWKTKLAVRYVCWGTRRYLTISAPELINKARKKTLCRIVNLNEHSQHTYKRTWQDMA